MKLYAPKYYKKFICIADKCHHSCCIGWEIDVDEDTLEKYDLSKESYAEKIRKSIEYTDTPHFKLGNSERCPHLNEKGLCRIILEMGEGYLCHICREHPRFYNYTRLGKEVGLGLVCEEACRIILSSDDYDTFIPLGEEDEECITDTDFDVISERAAIYKILSNDSLSFNEKTEQIAKKYAVSPTSVLDERWSELLSALEYLDPIDKKLFSAYSSEILPTKVLEKYLERALAYFIFRHVSPSEDERDFRASLGLALFLERLLRSVIVTKGDFGEPAIFDIARRLSEELEYSEENTEAIKFEFEFIL